MRSLREAMRKPMSVVDTAWLRMDTADNLMVINGVMEFETPLAHADLIRLLSERLLAKAPRFGTRPVQDQGRYFWESAPDMDWSYHAPLFALPEGDDLDRQLQEACSQIVAETLDPTQPLWRFYLIESFRGGSAVVIKVHHSYADGIALISTLDAIADTSVLQSSPAARAGFKAPLVKGDAWYHHAQHFLHQGIFYIGFAAAWLFEALRVALLPPDTKTLFKQALSSQKRVAWAPSLPIDEVKRVGRAMGGTVNDVVMACAAGSLRRYLVGSGQAVEGVIVRATVPVNLRPLAEAMELGNCFGLVYLALPVAEASPEGRVHAVRKSMSGLKNGAQAMMSYGILSILGFFPTALQRLALNFFSSKASAVMTNVPGPTEPVFLMGAKIRRAMFWVPQSGDIGIGISILSYAHRVEFGVVADTSLVNDPQVLVDGFVAEFEALRQGLVTDEVRGAKSCAV